MTDPPRPGKPWLCLNRDCGKVLGHVTASGDLVLQPGTRVEFGHWATSIICECGVPKAWTGRKFVGIETARKDAA